MKHRIEPNARVVLDYTLRDEDNEILDASDADGGEPMIFIFGYGMIVPGLEKELVGLSEGDSKDVIVSPDEGYGDRDEELVMEIDRSELPRPDAVMIGDEFVAESADGEEAIMHVIDVKPDAVTVDGNHPLAGETLRYAIRVREVRPATPEEIAEQAMLFEDLEREAREQDPPRGERGRPEPKDLVQLGKKKSPPN